MRQNVDFCAWKTTKNHLVGWVEFYRFKEMFCQDVLFEQKLDF